MLTSGRKLRDDAKAAWPTEIQLRDPYEDDHWRRQGDGWEDYLASEAWRVAPESVASHWPWSVEMLSQQQYRSNVESLRDALDAARCHGEVDPVSIDTLSRDLRVSGGALHDLRHSHPVVEVATASECVRLATDHRPAMGMDALDHVLGPLSATKLPNRWCLYATAQGAFAEINGIPQSPFSVWRRRKPRPSLEERDRFRHLHRTPIGLWRLESSENGRWWLTDLIGLHRRIQPDGPVKLNVPATTGPLRVGQVMTGRVLRGPDGWDAHLGMVWPEEPPREQLTAWVQLEWLEARIVSRTLTLEDLLRVRGHVLVRRVTEWHCTHCRSFTM